MGDFWEELSNVANGVGDVIDVIQQVKALAQGDGEAPASQLPSYSAAAPTVLPMPPFRAAMQDPYDSGARWLPQLQQLASQHGDGWVPAQTEGLNGINLTGLWAPPMNPLDQTYIRQSGPYLNLIAGVGGIPGLYAEGLFDPRNGIVRAVGQYATGAPMEVQAELSSNWTLQGWLSTYGPFGQPVTGPIFMARMA